MRIVNEFNLGPLKCTLFVNNSKYTFKIEDEFGEVSYKLGNLADTSLDLFPSLIATPGIRDSIVKAFRAMREGRDSCLKLLMPGEENDFENII